MEGGKLARDPPHLRQAQPFQTFQRGEYGGRPLVWPADRPLSTADVARAVGVSPVGTEAYRALRWLERKGHVDSAPQPGTGNRSLYWQIPTQRTSEESDRAQ